MSLRSVAVAALFSFVVACAEDPSTSLDGGIDGAPVPDAAPALVEPDAPMMPMLPRMGPCPEGWATVDVAGTEACEPWPLAAGPGCTPGEVRFPGDAACAPLGPPCPVDGVPTDLPPGPVLYVQAGAPPGDGSLGAPFGTINEALLAAAAGGVVAVAVGVYPEVLDLTTTGGVSVVGACAAETILEAAAGLGGSVAVLIGGGSHLERMTIRGARPGLRVQGAGTATTRQVWIEASGFGLVATAGGTLEAESLVVRGAPLGEISGWGAFLNGGARLEIRRGSFENVHTIGVAITGEASAVLEDTVVRNVTEDVTDGTLGNGITVQNSGTVTLRRVLLEHVKSAALVSQLSGAATLEDVVVRDVTIPDAGDDLGLGILVQSGGSATMNRVRLEQCTINAIGLVGYRSGIVAQDLVIHDVRPRADGRGGGGFILDTGVTANVARVLVHRARGAALSFAGADLDVSFRDVTTRATLPDAHVGSVGFGLELFTGARASFERLHVYESAWAGLNIGGADTQLTVTDVLVEGTHPANAMGGRGANIQAGANIDCTRCAFRDNVEVGLLLHGEGTGATLRELIVEDTAASATSLAGMGVVALAGANGDIERFAVRRQAVAGLQLAGAGVFRIRDGSVTHNPIGVNVQGAAPITADLTDRVIYLDNGRHLDSAELPIPEARP